MYVFLPTYCQEALIQAQKWRRQRNYDLRMRQKTRIEHRPREGRLTEIRSGSKQNLRTRYGEYLLRRGARKAARNPRLTEKKFQVI